MTTYTIPEFLTVMKYNDVRNAISVKDSLKTIAEVCNYILHPAKAFLLLWNWTFELSYIICLLISLFGFFMVLTGSREHKKYIAGGIIGYFFIGMLNMFITQ